MRSKVNHQIEVKRKFMFLSGHCIEVCKGDVTEELTDIIVTDSHKDLGLTCGLGPAISRRGGFKVKKECEAWITKYGAVKTGSCAVTSGGNLPCKYIVHGVGPMWYDGRKREDQELLNVIYCSLQIAHELNARSISIPLLSTCVLEWLKKRGVVLRCDKATEKDEENKNISCHPSIPFQNSTFPSIFKIKTSNREVKKNPKNSSLPSCETKSRSPSSFVSHLRGSPIPKVSTQRSGTSLKKIRFTNLDEMSVSSLVSEFDRRFQIYPEKPQKVIHQQSYLKVILEMEQQLFEKKMEKKDKEEREDISKVIRIDVGKKKKAFK